jgi:hypothetical protein
VTFVDAGPALADLFEHLYRADDPPLQVNRQPDVKPGRVACHPRRCADRHHRGAIANLG